MSQFIDNWDELFIRHVYLIGSKSKDESTQIGAVLVQDGGVVSEGYNGICRGVNDKVPKRSVRPDKYHWTEHGERNAIYNAAKRGIKTDGGILYTNSTPCTDCARAIIQCGIKEIVYHRQWDSIWIKVQKGKWNGHDDITSCMFNEAGIRVRFFNKKLGIKCLIAENLYEV